MKTSIPCTGLIIMALLSGCRAVAGGPLWAGAATPEAAVIQMLASSRTIMSNFQVDVNSVNVRQSVPLGDRVLVMVSFRGTQGGAGLPIGPQQCLFTYEVQRGRLGGWSTGSGGGGCTGVDNQSPNPEPMIIGESCSSGSGPGISGYCTVDSEVFQKDIVAVLVSWNDNQVQKVSVINGTFIAARVGQYKMVKVDGLNEAGDIVYTFNQFPAPGKK